MFQRPAAKSEPPAEPVAEQVKPEDSPPEITGVKTMQFKLTTSSGAPTQGLNFNIEIPDSAAREYTTVVNAGIAAVIGKAGEILVKAENEQNIAKFQVEGMKLAAEILARDVD